VDDGPYADALIAVIPVLGVHAQVMADSMALIWMNPAQQGFTKRAVDAVRNTPGLNLQGGAPLIERILYSLNQSFNDPTTDPRMPDITVIATPGVIYTGGSKLGEHGAFGKDDISVALFVHHPLAESPDLQVARPDDPGCSHHPGDPGPGRLCP